MEPHFWPTIEELFSRAIQLPVGQRAAFIESQSSNPDIRREVNSLLEHVIRSGAFLEPDDESNVGRALVDAARELDWSSKPVRLDSPKNTFDAGSSGNSNEQQISALADRLRREFAEHLPQYKLQELLGSGGEAAVFSAIDKQLGRPVAVRVLHLTGSAEQDRQRVIRESRALSRIHNEHVVTVYSVHVDGELALLVSELVDGPTLKQLLVTHGALRPRVAADLVRQAALGVAAAHQHSIVHCDIKPRNILLTVASGHESGYLAKISDFGFAVDDRELAGVRFDSSSQTDPPATAERPGSFLSGTLPYICPERIESSVPPDPAADVYGLGITLYQALTGQLPYRGARHMIVRQIVEGDPVHPRRLDDRIPEDLENVCLRAMAREPSLRYPTAALLAEDLRRYLDGEPTSVRPATTLRKLRSFARRNWQSLILGSVATALLMVLVAGTVIALNSNRNRQSQILSMQTAITDVQASELLMADHGMLQFAISKMDILDDTTREKIRRVADDPAADQHQRLNAAIVRLHLGEPVMPEIVRLLPEVAVRPALLQLLLAARDKAGDAGHEVTRLAMEQSDPEFRAQLSLMAWAFGEPAALKKMCNDLKRPDARTMATMLLRDWHPAIEDLVTDLRQEPDPLVRYCIITGIGRIDPRSLNRYDLRLLYGLLQEQSGESSAAGIRSACVWTAGKLGLAEPPAGLFQAIHGRDWEQTPSGLTMVQIQPGTTVLGAIDPRIEGDYNLPHQVTLTREFWIAATETSIAQFKQFLNDQDLDPALKPAGFDAWLPDPQTSPTPGHPVTRVSWIDGVLYCNWLSSREGLEPCYRFESAESTVPDDPPIISTSVQINYSANGYRLPTEAEIEFASRAGGQSSHWFGDNLEWMSELVTTSSLLNVSARPCGDLMPNPWGLHELEGNVWEWCHDWYEPIGLTALTDPQGPDAPGTQFGMQKTYRGGGVNTQRGSAEVSGRGHDDPSRRWSNLGFRVVRQKSVDPPGN